MRAAQLFGPADLRIVDLPVPVPGPDQALIRVVRYAPYGTDVGTYLNRYGRYVTAYPVGIGADFSGVVEALGTDVSGLKPGDRVAALALDHCGVCSNCETGRTNLCLDPAFKKPARQTCCEEFTLVSASKLAVLPDAVSFEDASMLAGIVDALNAFEQMGLKQGDTVAIIGVGAMGLGAIATAAALGFDIVALGGTGKRCDIARSYGAHVLPIASHGEDLKGRALAHQAGGFAAVMETTASDWGLAQAFAVAAPGGIVAVTGGGDLKLSAWDLVERELRLVGIRAGHHQQQALELIASGRLSLRQTVNDRFPLDRVSEAFAHLAGEQAKDIGRLIIEIGDAE